eukprot:scaffold6136_cov96-Isochrysis_galbana.AAC.1
MHTAVALKSRGELGWRCARGHRDCRSRQRRIALLSPSPQLGKARPSHLNQLAALGAALGVLAAHAPRGGCEPGIRPGCEWRAVGARVAMHRCRGAPRLTWVVEACHRGRRRSAAQYLSSAGSVVPSTRRQAALAAACHPREAPKRLARQRARAARAPVLARGGLRRDGSGHGSRRTEQGERAVSAPVGLLAPRAEMGALGCPPLGHRHVCLDGCADHPQPRLKIVGRRATIQRSNIRNRRPAERDSQRIMIAAAAGGRGRPRRGRRGSRRGGRGGGEALHQALLLLVKQGGSTLRRFQRLT